jgi:hypothetical protein
MKKQQRLVTFSAAPIGKTIIQVGQGTRRLVEKRVGPKPFAVVDGAVNYLRRSIAPAAGKFYQPTLFITASPQMDNAPA